MFNYLRSLQEGFLNNLIQISTAAVNRMIFGSTLSSYYCTDNFHTATSPISPYYLSLPACRHIDRNEDRAYYFDWVIFQYLNGFFFQPN